MLAAAAAAGLAAQAAVVDSSYAIVIPDGEPSGVQRALATAATALQDALKEGAGLDLAVVEKSKAPAGKAIWIGAEFAERDGLDLSGYAKFDNLVAEKDGNVYLCGRDRGREGQRNLGWQRCTLASVKAVTRFMHDILGVRFLAPGKVGRDVPRLDRVEVPEGLRSTERPRIDYGSGRYYEMMFDIANNNVGAGAYHSYGGHSYEPAVPADRYFKDHPEYFGLISGKRVYMKHGSVLCISNPEVQQLMVDELCRQFDAGADVCQLGQQDGFIGCQCDRCRAFGGPEAEDWGEKLWILHADIARRLEKLRPGKVVHIMCYGPTAHPPKTFRKFPSNVMVEQCRTSEEAFHEWDGYEVPHGFTVYTYLWGEYPRPGYTAKNSCDYLAWFARFLLKNRVHGIYRCGYGELFGTEGPGYWVFNSLLGDPDLSVRSLVNEYCERAYGPASAPMLLFHDTLDGRLGSKPGKAGPPGLAAGLQLDHFAYVYSPDATKVMDAALARAEATPGLTDKQRKRIALVRTEYDYARNLGRIATLYAAYKAQPSWALFDPLAEQVVARNAMLDSLYTGPKGAMRAVEGWPEIRLFGAMRRSMMAVNGRLGATLGAPLGWDVKYLKERGVLPGAAKKTVKAAREASAAEWNDLGGVQLQKIDKRARFRVSYDERALRIEMESDLDDGVKVKDYGRDAAVWGDESADILIDPTGQGDKVYHLIWSPVDGAVYDEAYGLVTDVLDPKFGTFDPYWNGKGWAITNVRRDNRWLTAVEIPFAMLGVSAPKPGDRWRLNVAREWNISCRGNPPAVAALWSPNLETGSFLNRDAMGELTF